MHRCDPGLKEHHGHLPRLVALAAAIGLTLASMPALAHHQSGTLSPSNTMVSWNNPLVAGVNNPTGGEGNCIEDNPTPGAGTCETFVLTLAPGDYSYENEIVVKISWENPGNDWDTYVHEDSPDGPEVARNTAFDPPDGIEAETSWYIGPIASPKTYYIRIVASSVASPGYSGQATFRMLPTPTLRHSWGRIKTLYR